MNWTHRVNPEWLQARKKYLSASDIAKLVPVTATGRARANIGEAYLKAWANKQCRVTEDDICSSGVMARGHLLEPYAITEFNTIGVAGMEVLRHWDDCLIWSPDGVSCSPDALDIERPISSIVEMPAPPAKNLGEVKAYNTALHYAIGLSKSPMLLEERWQIATAFHVMPTLETAALIMYNPTASHPLFYHLYTRADLHDELEMVKVVSADYKALIAGFDIDAEVKCSAKFACSCVTEESIIEELLEQMAVDAGLNP